MRKGIIIVIFLIGLGVFSYPFVANMFSTKVHQSVISEYEQTASKLDVDKKSSIAKEAKEHNEKLSDEPMEFIDPFENGTENSGNQSYYSALNIGPAMGTLTITGIGVNLPIYHGSSEAVLSKGVGHLENSSLPLGNKGEHSVLTAHRGLPSSKLFRNINDVAVGDEFSIQILDEIMTYKVFDINIVLPHETDWLQMNDDKSLLTLLSCEPYMINTHRMLVTGELIGKEVTEKQAEEKPYKLEGSNNFWYLIMGISLLFIGTIIFLLLRRRKEKDRGEQ